MNAYTTRVHGMQVAAVAARGQTVFFKTLKLARAYAKANHPNGGYSIGFSQVAAGTQVRKSVTA